MTISAGLSPRHWARTRLASLPRMAIFAFGPFSGTKYNPRPYLIAAASKPQTRKKKAQLPQHHIPANCNHWARLGGMQYQLRTDHDQTRQCFKLLWPVRQQVQAWSSMPNPQGKGVDFRYQKDQSSRPNGCIRVQKPCKTITAANP